MLQTWRNSSRLFRDFNTLQFAGVMSMVIFVLLLIFMTIPTHPHHGISVDLAKVSHPVPMPGVLREDAMQVWVTRDGKLYFGSDQILAEALPGKIQQRLEDRDVERKVYIKADMRARWGSVKPVLDGVRSAGILRVAFLADQRRIAASAP
jgi:biopolymer transport protein TolR